MGRFDEAMQEQTQTYYQEAINRAIEFIESNTNQDIRLSDIAAHTNLSKYHFHRIFKSLIGATLKEYVTRIRVEKAAILLKNSDQKISEIAFDCGYASPETFNRAFKNHFSVSPSVFREHKQEALEIKKVAHQRTSLESLQLSSPKIVELQDLELAYIRHFGDYNKVGKSFQRLLLWATKNLVLKLKPQSLGIVHDDPDLTAEPNIRFDACILVSKAFTPKGEIGYKRIQGGKFAVFRYKGPYDSFYEVYDYIYNVCLFENNWELRDQPALEWYLKSPPFYKPENYVTDFYLPIV